MNPEMTIKDGRAAELLRSYREGNRAAFTEIYHMYIQMLLNYGHCLTTNTELIKDCIQDVFVKLLDKQDVEGIRRVGSFLIISLRNRLVDEFRHANFTIEASVEDMHYTRSTTDVESDYLRAEMISMRNEYVEDLLKTLTPRQRQAFQLYYMEERKYDEICQLMNMNYHSVRNLVHRGMLRLRSVAV